MEVVPFPSTTTTRRTTTTAAVTPKSESQNKANYVLG